MNKVYYFKVGKRNFSALKQDKSNKTLYLVYSSNRYGRFSLCISESDFLNIENKDTQTKVAKLWINAYC